MNIILTEEQEAIVTDKMIQNVTAYAQGLIAFELDEARQAAEKLSADLDAQRLAELKADEVKLAEIDRAINAKTAKEVVEPVKKSEEVLK